jgi:hypothetical protein
VSLVRLVLQPADRLEVVAEIGTSCRLILKIGQLSFKEMISLLKTTNFGIFIDSCLILQVFCSKS